MLCLSHLKSESESDISCLFYGICLLCGAVQSFLELVQLLRICLANSHYMYPMHRRQLASQTVRLLIENRKAQEKHRKKPQPQGSYHLLCNYSQGWSVVIIMGFMHRRRALSFARCFAFCFHVHVLARLRLVRAQAGDCRLVRFFRTPLPKNAGPSTISPSLRFLLFIYSISFALQSFNEQKRTLPLILFPKINI